MSFFDMRTSYTYIIFTRLCLVARLLGLFSVLPQLSMSPLTCYEWLPRHILGHSLEAINHAKHLTIATTMHKLTHAHIQVLYPSSTRVGGGEGVAHPFWEIMSDLYNCVGDFVCVCVMFRCLLFLREFLL